MRSLVGGFIKEAQTGTAIWEDVDKDTFALFAQFVYTGDYTPLHCGILEDFRTASLDNIPREEPTVNPTEALPAEEQETEPGLYVATSIEVQEGQEQNPTYYSLCGLPRSPLFPTNIVQHYGSMQTSPEPVLD